MIDYKYKSQILNSGLCDIQKNVSKTLYTYFVSQKYNLDVSSNKIPFQDALNIDTYYEQFYPKEWKEAEKINRASYKRVKYLRGRIKSMIVYPSLFLTLTFTDDVLKSTSSKTRRDYVQRFLRNLECNYVGNIDFGKLNGREHYHAVVQVKRIDYSLWHYGAIKGEKIRLDKSSSAERLAKYVSKLTNHAIKETTKRNAIMYSRIKYTSYPDDLIPVLPCYLDKVFA